MTWKPPKINYIPADGVTDDDLNRVEGNTLDNHDRVDKIVDGTIPAAEATNADNADKLGGQSGDYYFDTAAESLVKIKTVDGTLSGLDADLLDGKHYADIQSWVNTSADVPNADHADTATNATNATNADNADTVDGKHLVNIASGSIAVDSNTGASISLNPGGVHHFYIFSVYDTNGVIVTQGIGTNTTAYITQTSNGVDYLEIFNDTLDNNTFHYQVLELS